MKNQIIKRLFDTVDYQLSNFPQSQMLSTKVNGQWLSYSTKDVKKIVDDFSAGLIKLGISGGNGDVQSCDKIAIISKNCPEWIFTDLAVQQTGAILVPLYPTNNNHELEFILNEVQAKYLFVGDAELYEKMYPLQSHVPSLKKIISFDQIDGVTNWKEIIALSNDALLNILWEVKDRIQISHVATIIYTSGTTGTPKGVMLTHKNIYSDILFSKRSFPFADHPGYRSLSFLPLNHIFEKLMTYLFLFSGVNIFFAENMNTVAENMKEVKPNCFSSVPRVLEKIFERIEEAGSHLQGFKKLLFNWSIRVAEKFEKLSRRSFVYRLKLKVADFIIFRRWRLEMGGHLEFIVVGGAACQVRLLNVFYAAGIPIYEGYGPTENSPVICVNRFGAENIKFGTVGPPIDGIEVRLAEDGEICVKGDTVMIGYFKRPDLTARVIKDGWLYTGDIGCWVEKKFLKITDRKKELFKTSGGKYVAPQPIENRFRENPFIEQIMLVGNDRKFVGALIVPAYAILKRWLLEKGFSYNDCENEKIIQKPEVIALYNTVVNRINPEFNHVEQVKKFVLMKKEWGINSGEVTPKLSIRRNYVLEKYKNEIASMYRT